MRQEDTSMKLHSSSSRVAISQCAVWLVLVGATFNAGAQQFESGKKGKVTGVIQSRNGDLVTIRDKKGGAASVIDLTDSTKIERKRDFRLRDAKMDVTALVPGLTIDAEGVGNENGQLAASKITFDPNVFAIEVAEEQQIRANQSAAGRAQSTANQGVAAANQAQTSANTAQTSADAAQTTANQAGQAAVAAGAIGVADADAVALVNKRVSDLADYKTVAEADVFFPTGQDTLSADDKAALSKLASDAAAVQNYMIEVAGYASSTGTPTGNLKLSDDRAAVVANYLRDSANVPMRRILLPAGYGATHPLVSNQTVEGRDINRRVDVKVIVNKGIEEGATM
jgi:outer membrane protein OmpA-like peptidoglycan-associated protein